MGSVNPIIIKAIEEYAKDNPDFPKELFEKLLEVEKIRGFEDKNAAVKVYEQIIEKNRGTEIVEWSKKFVDNN